MNNWLSTEQSYFSNVFRVGQFSIEVAAGTHIGRKDVNQDFDTALTKLVQDLIDDALGQGTRDNITIALARVSSS